MRLNLNQNLLEHLAQQRSIKKTLYIPPYHLPVQWKIRIILQIPQGLHMKIFNGQHFRMEPSYSYMQWLHLTGFQMSILRNPPISYILDVTPTCHNLPHSYNQN